MSSRSRTPDIIITDLMMPVTDGHTLCRTLKADLRTSHIPIIMLTAKDTPDDQCQGYADGADSYLTKPFSMQMLRTRLQNLLNAQHRLADTMCLRPPTPVDSAAFRTSARRSRRCSR